MELLEMHGIYKSFCGVPVLEDVSLTVKRGEVHALLGENGAGKSTLMNILTGVHTRDEGTIYFDGEDCQHMTVTQAEKLGIAFVHQELNLFEDLTVWENIFLTREYTKAFGRVDKKRMVEQAQAFFTRMGVHLDPLAQVSDLKISEKQLLEIAKALFFQAKLLILDEPTTSLSQNEIAHLFDMIGRLKEKGVSFLFISHKMPEIFQIADRYTVLRNGKFVRTGEISEITPDEMTALMVGKSGLTSDIYCTRPTGETVLKLEHWSGDGFADVDLEVKRGQIIALTGLQGSGSGEVLQSIFGCRTVNGGTMEVFGQQVQPGSIHRAMRAKIAMLPGDRKENSVVPDMNLLENMYLAEHTLSLDDFRIHKKLEHQRFDHYRELLHIRMNQPEDSILSLSGGNQQKVFLARWLNTNAELLLLENPTQGIDVGAKAEIYELMLELAASGKTILLSTQEIPEIYKTADACAVFYNGRLKKILPHDEIDEETVMRYATNANEVS
ncbi:sugar ABC transporter ATP-binding protein [Butyricicoccus pullicaecorum]|uniref:Sugar ABC transporter ATP-binding protein n=1 Tax=Butyricicoccus pullicaecorum TaxID=501571 RepID=A0A1Y4L7J6_9FIRM|nr:sugar ABC transporter ATP-binding protein [Butyricicoccus pullicaecorum]OUP51840.1 sugar ABC transporter ATP-binding protein [Butyricicoccus pullicaecorum]